MKPCNPERWNAILADFEEPESRYDTNEARSQWHGAYEPPISLGRV